MAHRRQRRPVEAKSLSTHGEKKRRPRRLSWSRYQGLVILTVIGAIAVVGTVDKLTADDTVEVTGGTSARPYFGVCHVGGGTNCVVDGDTIWLEGQNIRLADIDAPETHDPKCASERALGDRATVRLQNLLNSGDVTVAPIGRDQDKYGRKLRVVRVSGSSVGDTLVSDGLARPFGKGKRPWC